MDDTTTFAISYPPSANTYYRRVGSRTLISRRGREYRADVIGEINWPSPLAGRLAVVLDTWPPDRRRRDLDNIQKPVLDAMQHAGVYRDDSQVDLLVTRRREVVRGGRMMVSVGGWPTTSCPLCGGILKGTM